MTASKFVIAAAAATLMVLAQVVCAQDDSTTDAVVDSQPVPTADAEVATVAADGLGAPAATCTSTTAITNTNYASCAATVTTVASITLTSSLDVTTISFPHLVTVTGSISIQTNNKLTGLQFDSLASVGGSFTLTGASATPLTALNFPLLATITKYLDVESFGKLQTLSFPVLTSVASTVSLHAGFDVENNGKLTALSAPALLTVGWTGVVIKGTSLTTIDLSALTTIDNAGTLILGGDNPLLSSSKSWVGLQHLTTLASYSYDGPTATSIKNMRTCDSLLNSFLYNYPCNHCTPGVCQNGGVCDDGASDQYYYMCSCPDGTGLNCENNHNDCPATNACNGQGTCNDGIKSYSCSCNPDYTGKDCETKIDDCPATNACNGQGTCNDGIKSYSCSCNPDYTGKDCETKIDDCPTTNACNGHGVCEDGIKSYSCHCDTDYTGKDCETDTSCATGFMGDACTTPCLPHPTVSDPTPVYELAVVTDSSDSMFGANTAITQLMVRQAIRDLVELPYDSFLFSAWGYPLNATDSLVHQFSTTSAFSNGIRDTMMLPNQRKATDPERVAEAAAKQADIRWLHGDDWKYMLDSVDAVLAVIKPGSQIILIADSEELCDPDRFSNDRLERVMHLHEVAVQAHVTISFFTVPTDNSGCLPSVRKAAKAVVAQLVTAETGGVVGPVPEVDVSASNSDMRAAMMTALKAQLTIANEAQRCPCKHGGVINTVSGLCP